MPGPVLDASALLAAIFDEAGADRVAEHLPGATLSAVNLAEVLAKLCDLGMPDGTIAAIIEGLQLTILPCDAAHARETARLRRLTRSAGLSLGDRACLATASLGGTTALSADRAWARLPAEAGVQVEWVR
ncbi:type II toxin-antitoxin system VapC family toxin [Methylobacterium sp. J-076]|uniref:type II toxin-antitoxin system VapC family toxin n=1 Tax=Methylobacterium sp. J-076 TaxID=2836655 RepID=UPI001FBB888C|nr:type II toxin-antitoxin system VapC family toxin [Methylobacterium sp. J-076]MCJ2013534.1 type II toxin-antitoxin system VapC family toxin [Methylobacterium sp. J-076]